MPPEAPAERKIYFLRGLLKIGAPTHASGLIGLSKVFTDVLESNALRV